MNVPLQLKPLISDKKHILIMNSERIILIFKIFVAFMSRLLVHFSFILKILRLLKIYSYFKAV